MLTDEQKTRILEMYGRNLSAGVMVRAFEQTPSHGVPTRNSIIGFLHRNGLRSDSAVRLSGAGMRSELPEVRPPVIRQPHRFDAPNTPKKAKAMRPEKAIAREPLRVFIADLQAYSCRYVLGEPEDMTFCGLPMERGRFCAEHGALCYVTLAEARRARA